MIEHIRWALRQKVGGNVKLVLVSLANHADATGYCFPSQDVIGEEASMTGRNVRRVLVTLIEQGYVVTERRHRSDGSRSTNGYRLLMEAGVTERRLPDKLSSRPADLEDTGGTSKRTTVSSQEAPVKHQETVNAGADWDEFWKLYPKKQAKPTAQKAWVAARKKSPAADIIAGLQRWLPTYASRDTRYVPQPSRWLNEERWNDEPDPPDDRKPTGRPPERPRVDPQREWEYR